MYDTTQLVSNPERLNEMAMAYFNDRLNAISADVSALENAHREGKLVQNEFLRIRRALIQAKREVQVALDGITNVDGPADHP
jgi:phage terminase Nu1 subunit (DNA packaging protein)